MNFMSGKILHTILTTKNGQEDMTFLGSTMSNL